MAKRDAGAACRCLLFGPDVAAVRGDDVAADGQAQPGAAGAGIGAAALAERFENGFLSRPRGMPTPSSLTDTDHLWRRLAVMRRAQGNAVAGGRELDGVAKKVGDTCMILS